MTSPRMLQIKVDLSRSYRAAYRVLQKFDQLESLDREGLAQDTVRLAGSAIESMFETRLTIGRSRYSERQDFPDLLAEVERLLPQPLTEEVAEPLKRHRPLRNKVVHPRERRYVPSANELRETIQLSTRLAEILFQDEDWEEQRRLSKAALNGEILETILSLPAEELALERLKRRAERSRSIESPADATVNGASTPGTPHAWAQLITYYVECLRHEAAQAFRLERKEPGWQERCRLLVDRDKEVFLSTSSPYLELKKTHNSQDLIDFLNWTSDKANLDDLCYAYPFFISRNGDIMPVAFTRVAPDVLNGRIILRREQEAFEINIGVFPRRGSDGSSEEDAGYLAELDDLWNEKPEGSRFEFVVTRLVELLRQRTTVTIVQSVPEHTTVESLPHNAIVFAPLLVRVRPGPTQYLLQELAVLKGANYWENMPDGMKCIIRQKERYDYPHVDETSDLHLADAATDKQQQAILSAKACPLTVVTGPPGTGKSQLVVNLVAHAVLNGKTVLFASKNNQAVEVVMSKLEGVLKYPGAVRTGKQSIRQQAIQQLGDRFGLIGSSYDRGPWSKLRAAEDKLKQDRCRLLADLERQDTLAQMMAQLQIEEQSLLQALGREWEPIAAQPQQGPSTESTAALRPAVRALLAEAERINTGQLALGERIWALLHPNAPSEKLAKLTLQTKEELSAKAGLALPDLDGSTLSATRHYAEQIERLLDLFELRQRLARHTVSCGSLGTPELVAMKLKALRANHQLLTQQMLREHWNIRQADLSPAAHTSITRFIAAGQQSTAAYGRNRPSQRALQDSTIEEVLKVFPVWATTNLSTAQSFPLRPGLFDYVVIDEASQCDISSALPLLYRGKHAVIIGDSRQLRHVSTIPDEVDSRCWQVQDLDELDDMFGYKGSSLFELAERAATNQPGTILLDVHFRSHPAIIQFSNQAFYRERLTIQTDLNRYEPVLLEQAGGVFWLQTAGRTERTLDGGNTNSREAEAVCALLDDLMAALSRNSLQGYTIGVVTPFAPQKQLLQDMIVGLAAKRGWTEKMPKVGTVHTFQGDERDFIIFSPVVSRDAWPGTVKWLSLNRNLINVALTRARLGLFIVGDMERCRTSADYLGNLVEYVQKAGTVVTDRRQLPLFKGVGDEPRLTFGG